MPQLGCGRRPQFLAFHQRGKEISACLYPRHIQATLIKSVLWSLVNIKDEDESTEKRGREGDGNEKLGRKGADFKLSSS